MTIKHLFIRSQVYVRLSNEVISLQFKHLLGGNRERVMYACCPLKLIADRQACYLEILKKLLQQASLKSIQGIVLADDEDIKITTVTLPRMPASELRQLMVQTAFWQEYLGVTMSEWHLWSQRLSSASPHEVRFLLAALPMKKADWYMSLFQQAGLLINKVLVEHIDNSNHTAEFFLGDRKNNRNYYHRYSFQISLFLLLLSMGAYTHWTALEKNQYLQMQYEVYQQLTTDVQRKQQQLSNLKKDVVLRDSLFADTQNVVTKQRYILQLLETAVESLLPGMWLNKTEFRATSLYIIGQAFDNELVVHYVGALESVVDMCEVSIKQLSFDTETRMHDFVIECHLTANHS